MPGGRHELMMERDAMREQFWAAFDAFVSGGPEAQPAGEAVEHLAVQVGVAGGARCARRSPPNCLPNR